MKVPKLTEEQVLTINLVTEKIKIHPDYNKSIKQALEDGFTLSLNYHNHPGEETYCVSIISEKIDLISLSEDKQSFIELAHIKNIGQSEEDCLPIMSYLGEKIKKLYYLKNLPNIYLNGRLFMSDE